VVVRVGVGVYLWDGGGADVVVVVVVSAGVSAGAAVWGVMPEALAALMGLLV
jgi:hypothetical protein